jgi:hypothetical protein
VRTDMMRLALTPLHEIGFSSGESCS